jgi:hypothetical protein
MPACSKRPYPTAAEAARALRHIRLAHPDRGEVGIHPCRTCHAFHLTSASGSGRNKWTVRALKLKARPSGG